MKVVTNNWREDGEKEGDDDWRAINNGCSYSCSPAHTEVACVMLHVGDTDILHTHNHGGGCVRGRVKLLTSNSSLYLIWER